MSNKITRRNFVRQTAMGGVALSATTLGFNAKSYARIIGANDRVNCAMLGTYRRFGALAPSVSQCEDAGMIYVSDVDSRRMDRGAESVKKLTGTSPKKEKDLRKIIEDKDVDAVFVAIPDHWHAAATWMALQAGKHVYVEKPCSHNPRESEILIALQQKYGKVVQMGNQQRSAPESQEIISEIHGGAIGDVYLAKAFYSNGRGRVDNAQKTAVPDYLDWELFQGPAPRTDFIDIVADYNWHWFWEWGTGETGNNATHELDVARWALQVEYPDTVYVNAGKRHFKDDPWTMYDTMDATFEFQGGKKTIMWDGKSRTNYNTYGSDRGTIIYGSEGSVFVNRSGYRLYDRNGTLIRERKSRGEEGSTGLGGGGDMTTLHVQNFFDAIRGKSAQNSTIREGALSSNLSHYANISSRAGNAHLLVNPLNGRFLNKKIHKKYWGRTYEPGWEPPQI